MGYCGYRILVTLFITLLPVSMRLSLLSHLIPVNGIEDEVRNVIDIECCVIDDFLAANTF